MALTFMVKIRATLQHSTEVESFSASQACRESDWQCIWGCADVLHSQGRLGKAIDSLVTYEVASVELTEIDPGIIEVA
jgi:hypothetical protein